MQLEQVTSSLDAKITLLLNADQQKKFQEIREQYRRQLIEKMASKVMQKLDSWID